MLNQVPQLTGVPKYEGATVALDAAEAQAALDAAVAAWLHRYQKQADWQGRTYADWQTYQSLTSRPVR